MHSYYNPNPYGRRVGDCTVRAVSAAIDEDWDSTYILLCVQGFILKDMPNSNAIIDAFLKQRGFKRYTVPDTCPECYTIDDFCKDHPDGVYVIGTGTHVVAIIDGQIMDAWDSSNELVLYFYRKDDTI